MNNLQNQSDAQKTDERIIVEPRSHENSYPKSTYRKRIITLWFRH